MGSVVMTKGLFGGNLVVHIPNHCKEILGIFIQLDSIKMSSITGNMDLLVVVVVEYLYSASRSASNALIVPQRCEEMCL